MRAKSACLVGVGFVHSRPLALYWPTRHVKHRSSPPPPGHPRTHLYFLYGITTNSIFDYLLVILGFRIQRQHVSKYGKPNTWGDSVTADKKMNNKWNVKGAQARDIRLRVFYVNQTCIWIGDLGTTVGQKIQNWDGLDLKIAILYLA